MKTIPLLVIAGPTAAGKTAAAIRVARAVGGEIISADSMQIYRQLNVGTAKPTHAERQQARFHLIDFVDFRHAYTVADFQRDARQAIAVVWGRGALPILCGGTGLYIRAVVSQYGFPGSDPTAHAGVAPSGTGAASQARHAGIRATLEADLAAVGSAELHRRLAEVDPDAARRIPPGDTKRIVRALEVHTLTGQPISALQRVDADPWVRYNCATFVLDRPREVLYRAVERRVDEMMAAGWLEEAQTLRQQVTGQELVRLQALQAIGYRHLLQWMGEEAGGRQPPHTLSAVVDDIKRDSRRFAKRQLTWFRKEPGAQWLHAEDATDWGRAVRQLCRAGLRLIEAGGM